MSFNFINCNRCFTFTEDLKLYKLTDCGHFFCNECSSEQKSCFVCNKSSIGYMSLSEAMQQNRVSRFLTSASEKFVNMKNSSNEIEFQYKHLEYFINGLKKMIIQLRNDLAQSRYDVESRDKEIHDLKTKIKDKDYNPFAQPSQVSTSDVFWQVDNRQQQQQYQQQQQQQQQQQHHHHDQQIDSKIKDLNQRQHYQINHQHYQQSFDDNSAITPRQTRPYAMVTPSPLTIMRNNVSSSSSMRKFPFPQIITDRRSDNSKPISYVERLKFYNELRKK